ncbi:hypothetical protein H6B14_11160 [Phocaeicola coprophilus]|nr:hypothetical protein [Phocaeicola coprophilus]
MTNLSSKSFELFHLRPGDQTVTEVEEKMKRIMMGNRCEQSAFFINKKAQLFIKQERIRADKGLTMFD